MRTLCYPPTTFLVLRLKRKVDVAVGGRHANSHIFEQNAPQNLLLGMVPKENFLLVGCSSLHIVYEYLTPCVTSYHLLGPAVEE